MDRPLCPLLRQGHTRFAHEQAHHRKGAVPRSVTYCALPETTLKRSLRSSPLLPAPFPHPMPRFPILHSSPTLRALQANASRFLEHLFAEGRADGEASAPVLVVRQTDILETGERYRIRAELSRMDRQELRVTVTEKQLTICAYSPRQESQSRAPFSPPIGRYCQSIALPMTIDPAKGKAVLNRGFLIVDLPKARSSRGEPLGTER